MKILLAYVFAIVTIEAGEAATCSLYPHWKNELASVMNITCTPDPEEGSVGNVTGWYNSAVGAAQGWYRLNGRYTLVGNDIYLGWAVGYDNVYGDKDSVASWSGVYRYTDDTLYTTWLLTSYTSETWSDTRTGCNVFHPWNGY